MEGSFHRLLREELDHEHRVSVFDNPKTINIGGKCCVCPDCLETVVEKKLCFFCEEPLENGQEAGSIPADKQMGDGYHTAWGTYRHSPAV